MTVIKLTSSQILKEVLPDISKELAESEKRHAAASKKLTDSSKKLVKTIRRNHFSLTIERALRGNT